MASALQNPNDRRRINKITRHIMQTPSATVEGSVKAWLANASKPKSQRPKWMQRNKDLAKAVKTKRGAAFADAKPQSAAQKKAYTAIRAAVRREFQRQDPEGYKSSTRNFFGRKSTSSYAKRAAGSHASRYYKKSKKAKRKAGTGFLKGRDYAILDVADVQGWDEKRAMNRWSAAGEAFPTEWRKTKSPAKGRKSGHTIPWGTKVAAAPAKPARRRSAKKAKANPSLVPLGDLALTNPQVMGASNYFMGYALPVVVAGAAAGGVHALASTSGLTAKIADLVDKVPAVGPWVSENLPYTTQGLVVGSGLALLAPMIGGTAGKYLALLGGGALVVGGGIDAFNYAVDQSSAASDAAFEDELNVSMSSDLDSFSDDMGALALGDLALTNMGDLALTNMGDLAFTNFGDGLAYETAPLGAAPACEDYGQSSLADAHYCGADFAPEEGQALCNGRRSFMQRFGLPPIRMAGRAQSGPSHLAGRTGHRWGWLVRMIGWQRAQQIAALPPKKRVKFLRKLRRAAIASFNELKTEAQALHAEAHSANAELIPAAGTAASGAEGANGATNYLGEPALFMGA